jgi:hypothetical protein
LNHPDVSTWAQVQRQHFRAWEPGTALFIDSLRSLEENYSEVLSFVMKEGVTLQPLAEVAWVDGKYHD